MKLTDFLRARFDVEERSIEGTGYVAWLTYLTDDGQMLYTTVASGSNATADVDGLWTANGEVLPPPAHVQMVYDQDRKLLDLKAKRLQLALHEGDHECVSKSGSFLVELYGEHEPCPTLKTLALPYSGRSDFKQEWL